MQCYHPMLWMVDLIPRALKKRAGRENGGEEEEGRCLQRVRSSSIVADHLVEKRVQCYDL